MNQDGIKMEQISYTGLALDILYNFWIVLLVTAAVWLGATGIGTFTYTPQYTTEATLAVSLKGSKGNYMNLTTASDMTGVLGEVFQSDTLRKLILEDMGEETDAVIRSSQITDTNLLALEVVSSDPRQAYFFMNAALEHYKDVSGYVFDNASLEVLQEPLFPSVPTNASPFIARRTLLTALAFVGMIALFVFFYLFRFTVKNAESAKNQLDGDVLGVIPYEKKESGLNLRRKKSKKALLINSPVVSMAFSEASRKIESAVENVMQEKGHKVLLVTSVGENEGKSTVAANVAIAMAEKHKKVLLVDGDFLKPAMYKIFEQKTAGRESFDKVIRGKFSWREAVRFNEESKLWEMFQMRAVSETSKLLNPTVLEKLISEWREEMDYIVIDCPPAAVAADAEIWMQLADTVLIVTRQDWSDVRVINDTVDLIWQSGAEFSGFALNAFRKEWGTHENGEK